MKRLAIATLLSTAVLASVSAHASDVENLECGIITQTPTPSKKEEPVYKITIEAVFNARAGGEKWVLTEMTVQHTFVNGNTVERSKQYVDRVFHDTDTEATWRGRFIKDPSVTMTGTVKHDAKDRIFYTEKLYKQNRLVWTMVSQCHPIQVER